MPFWIWQLVGRHLRLKSARPAIVWMNVLAFLGSALGVFAWVAVTSIMIGLQNDIRFTRLGEKPHLVWEGQPRSDYRDIEARIRELLGKNLSGLSSLLRTEGLLEEHRGDQKGRSAGSGVIIEGRLDVESLQFGAELLSVTGFQPQSKLLLHSAWRLDKAPLELRDPVVFETGVYDIDKATIRMPKSELDRWLGLNDAASSIEVRLSDPDLAPEMRDRLAPLNLSFQTWREMDQALWYSLKLELLVMSMAIFFVVLLGALALYMALSVRVTEKAREIALLRGLGAPDYQLKFLYTFEGTILGTFGAIVGIGGAWLFCLLVSKYGALPSIYYTTHIPSDWSWLRSIGFGLVAIILSAGASYWPARKVQEFEIQEALRS